MKESYDFNKGKRGRISAPTPEPPGKEEITIRLDQDVIDHFFWLGLMSRGERLGIRL